MSRTSKPAAAPAEAPFEASIEGQAEGFAVNLGEIPAVIALNGLIGAVVALAGFPSSPVPDSLLQNLAKARQGFLDALKDPFQLPAAASDPADAYDDAWIKTDLAALGEQLKDRFAALDAVVEGLTKSAAENPPVDLSDIEARLTALEAAPPVDLDTIAGLVNQGVARGMILIETAQAADDQA
ncbi:MAG: hypothetical protein ACK4M2_01665 [Brevundimonas sp.]